MKISEYSEIKAVGSRYTQAIFSGPVVIQEKIDGSQFSFANVDGKLRCRSKNNMVGEDGTVAGLFARAYATANAIFETGTLPIGMVVRAEAVDKPKHNVLAYGRVPIGNVILYDIEFEDRSGVYASLEALKDQATMWGLETVPVLYQGQITLEHFQQMIPKWLEQESVLGGTKIEGVVVKNYTLRDVDSNILMAKYAGARFKEKMTGRPHSDKLSPVQNIVNEFNREAIWQKAVQHLRDAGTLKGNSRDIGLLVNEIKDDFKRENGEEVIEKLVKEYYREVEKGILLGFPQWYNQKLLEAAGNDV